MKICLTFLIGCIILCARLNAANFVVYHSDRDFATQVAKAAETYRRALALSWLGRELPACRSPCPIYPVVTNGAGAGRTTFHFSGGEVGGFEMRIQGTRRELLESVLPHEVLHTIFATHFRQPLPRWADEGAASSVESATEKSILHLALVEYLRNGRGIAFNSLFGLTEYPADMLPLYAEGYSVTTFLIHHDSRLHFVNFLAAGLRDRSGHAWPDAVSEFYGYRSLGELQNTWLDWLRSGSLPASLAQPSATREADYQQSCGAGGCQWQWRPGKGWVINRLKTRAKGLATAVLPGLARPNRPSSKPTNAAPTPPRVVPGSQQPNQWQAVTINVADGQAATDTGESDGEGGTEPAASATPTSGAAGPPGPRGPQGVPGPQGAMGRPGQDADQSQIVGLRQAIQQLQQQLGAAQKKMPPLLTVNLVDDEGNIIDSQQIRVGVDPLNLDLHPVKVQAPLAQSNGGAK